MRYRTPLLLTLATLALAAGPLAAQDANQPPYGPGPGGGLMQGITLTERQRAQFDSLRREHQLQLRELEQNRSRTGMADSAYYRERTKLRERQATQVRAMLDPAQQQTFDRNMEQARARLREQGQAGAGPQGKAQGQPAGKPGAGTGKPAGTPGGPPAGAGTGAGTGTGGGGKQKPGGR